ncbi:HNH endonuclease [Pinirhizobacter soli]|uniref:HNH endonuclease n=1 Tax=Pinirhizobacter soli TaxID=2786953 RepID=UPI003CCD0951
MNKLKKYRLVAFVDQRGLCCYCDRPMRLSDPKIFAVEQGMSTRQTRLAQATTEHIVPRQDGGSNARKNIAAACLACNCTRHRTKRPLCAEAYKRRVKKRVRKGVWFPWASPRHF